MNSDFNENFLFSKELALNSRNLISKSPAKITDTSQPHEHLSINKSQIRRQTMQYKSTAQLYNINL